MKWRQSDSNKEKQLVEKQNLRTDELMAINITDITCKIIQLSIWCKCLLYSFLTLALYFFPFFQFKDNFLLLHSVVTVIMQICPMWDQKDSILFQMIFSSFSLAPFLQSPSRLQQEGGPGQAGGHRPPPPAGTRYPPPAGQMWCCPSGCSSGSRPAEERRPPAPAAAAATRGQQVFTLRSTSKTEF